MRFSFVIPCYNNGKLLKNTIEALNYQEGYGWGDFEAVVVDDGSSDKTWKYIEGINRNYDLNYIYLERNGKSCRARTRNEGWKKARGEIIAFIDSDILVKPDYLMELDRCFSLRRDIILLGNRLMLQDEIRFEEIGNGEVFRKYCFDKENYRMMEYRYFLYETTSYNANAMMLPWTQVYSCNVAVGLKQLEEVNGFDEGFKGWGVEDIELGCALYERKVQIVVNPKLEVLHQYHGERNDLIIKKENIEGYDRNLDYFFKKHPDAVKMRREFSYKFLKGDIPDDKIFKGFTVKEVEIDFRERENLEHIKKLILMNGGIKGTTLVVNDYVEDTDLDIWVQVNRDKTGIVKYKPMSRKLEREKMLLFLDEEKSRQKYREEAKIN